MKTGYRVTYYLHLLYLMPAFNGDLGRCEVRRCEMENLHILYLFSKVEPKFIILRCFSIENLRKRLYNSASKSINFLRILFLVFTLLRLFSWLTSDTFFPLARIFFSQIFFIKFQIDGFG